MRSSRGLTAVLVAWVGLVSSAWAADEPTVKVATVAGEIDNPTGVAVQPGTGHVFVAARSGIWRYVPGDKLHAEITGFSSDIYGKGPMYNIGPLGIAFLSENEIVVGDGSQPDEKEVVLVYRAGKKAREKARRADRSEHVLGPIKAGPDSAKGEGNYYGVAVGPKAIYITCNGDDTKGWVARAELKGGKPHELKPFIATKVATNVDAPVGITMSPDQQQIVIGQMGEINVPGDSLLTMYDEAGKLLKSYKTGLNDIAGLAYSPKTGKLYCVDFSWVDTSKGGLFRLDVDGDAVKAVKIASLDKPTALGFDSSGALYITQLGTAAEGSEKPAGALLKIDSGL